MVRPSFQSATIAHAKVAESNTVLVVAEVAEMPGIPALRVAKVPVIFSDFSVPLLAWAIWLPVEG